MKLALVDDFAPALVIGDEVVDVSSALRGVDAGPPHGRMARIIERFGDLRPALGDAAGGGRRRPLARVRLRPPLPAPSKILCCMGGYMEGVTNGVRKGIDMFVKASSAVIGPGDTIVLPEAACPIFHHEAELGVVIGRRTKGVAESDAMRAVFGYVNFIDVSGRGFPLEPSIVSVPSFLGKSFDTFAPLGPWITTADEVTDVGRLDVRLWVNDEIRQDYSTTDAEHPVARIVAFASSVMTLEPGDIIACGTNHQGLGALQDGDTVRMEIDGLGPLTVGVRDPLKRTWPRTPDRAFAERVRSRRLPTTTP
jgi:2-keto-4-pentenoate hydratase/2-oxohepta-3-ene-1,7-dioic acid hydratase in catechol pathway